MGTLPAGSVFPLLTYKEHKMIILDGTITNKIINGVNGDFSVGTLQTEIGKFKIRSALLDQFEEGEYSVRAAVNKFDLNSYQSKRNGIIITEIEAHVDTLELIYGDIKPVDQVSIEPDASLEKESPATKMFKVDTESKKSVKPASGKIVLSNKKAKNQAEPQNADKAELEKLFGHLWPLGNEVKLDTTLPRPMIIKQKSYLSGCYDFNAKTQIWVKKNS
jgi:hypothetical protein